MLLALLYWIVLILSIFGIFIPDSFPHGRRISGAAQIILFILIGLAVFRMKF